MFFRVLKASGSNGSKNKEYLVVFDKASPLTKTDLFPKVPDRKSIWPSFKLNHRFLRLVLNLALSLKDDLFPTLQDKYCLGFPYARKFERISANTNMNNGELFVHGCCKKCEQRTTMFTLF